MTVFILVFFVALIGYCVLLESYRRWWDRIPYYLAGKTPATLKVSVVIAVRNEEKNIHRILNALQEQDYPSNMMEVLIVNDHSTDSTLQNVQMFADHLAEMGARTSGLNACSLRTIDLPPETLGKKAAITAGVHASNGEFIMTTDADCLVPPTWISTITSFSQSNQAKFVAAPVCMQPDSSVRGRFQSLDFLILQGITGAAVHRKFHRMCNGANIAYLKESFLNVNGFEQIDHIPSGDDMLLMQKIYEKYPDDVTYLKSHEATVVTFPEKSWMDFFNQRIRWSSKTFHYRDTRVFFVLALTYLVNLFFVAFFVTCFFNSNWIFLLILFLLAKILIEFPFALTVASFFQLRRLTWYFVVLQPLHILYIVIAGWLGSMGAYTWKSRRVRTGYVPRAAAKK